MGRRFPLLVHPVRKKMEWAYKEAGFKEHGLYQKISEKVKLNGPEGGHPGRSAVRKTLLKINADKEWYPGKVYGDKEYHMVTTGQWEIVTRTTKP